MKTEVRFAKVQPAPEYPTVFKSSSGHRMSQRRCPRGHDLHPITTIALKKRLMEKVGKVLKDSWRNPMSPSMSIWNYFGIFWPSRFAASWLRGLLLSSSQVQNHVIQNHSDPPLYRLPELPEFTFSSYHHSLAQTLRKHHHLTSLESRPNLPTEWHCFGGCSSAATGWRSDWCEWSPAALSSEGWMAPSQNVLKMVSLTVT